MTGKELEAYLEGLDRYIDWAEEEIAKAREWRPMGDVVKYLSDLDEDPEKVNKLWAQISAADLPPLERNERERQLIDDIYRPFLQMAEDVDKFEAIELNLWDCRRYVGRLLGSDALMPMSGEELYKRKRVVDDRTKYRWAPGLTITLLQFAASTAPPVKRQAQRKKLKELFDKTRELAETAKKTLMGRSGQLLLGLPLEVTPDLPKAPKTKGSLRVLEIIIQLQKAKSLNSEDEQAMAELVGIVRGYAHKTGVSLINLSGRGPGVGNPSVLCLQDLREAVFSAALAYEKNKLQTPTKFLVQTTENKLHAKFIKEKDRKEAEEPIDAEFPDGQDDRNSYRPPPGGVKTQTRLDVNGRPWILRFQMARLLQISPATLWRLDKAGIVRARRANFPPRGKEYLAYKMEDYSEIRAKLDAFQERREEKLRTRKYLPLILIQRETLVNRETLRRACRALGGGKWGIPGKWLPRDKVGVLLQHLLTRKLASKIKEHLQELLETLEGHPKGAL